MHKIKIKIISLNTISTSRNWTIKTEENPTRGRAVTVTLQPPNPCSSFLASGGVGEKLLLIYEIKRQEKRGGGEGREEGR